MHDLLVHGLAGGGEERKLCLGALALQDVDRRDRARATLVHHHALGDGPVDAPGLAALLGGRHILEAVIDGRLRDVELLLGLPAVLLALAAEGTLALAAGPAAAALLAELAAAFRAALAWRTVGTLAAVPAVAALAGASVPRRPVAPLPPRRATLALRTLRGGAGAGDDAAARPRAPGPLPARRMPRPRPAGSRDQLPPVRPRMRTRSRMPARPPPALPLPAVRRWRRRNRCPAPASPAPAFQGRHVRGRGLLRAVSGRRCFRGLGRALGWSGSGGGDGDGGGFRRVRRRLAGGLLLALVGRVGHRSSRGQGAGRLAPAGAAAYRASAWSGIPRVPHRVRSSLSLRGDHRSHGDRGPRGPLPRSAAHARDSVDRVLPRCDPHAVPEALARARRHRGARPRQLRDPRAGARDPMAQPAPEVDARPRALHDRQRAASGRDLGGWLFSARIEPPRQPSMRA